MICAAITLSLQLSIAVLLAFLGLTYDDSCILNEERINSRDFVSNFLYLKVTLVLCIILAVRRQFHLVGCSWTVECADKGCLQRV